MGNKNKKKIDFEILGPLLFLIIAIAIMAIISTFYK